MEKKSLNVHCANSLQHVLTQYNCDQCNCYFSGKNNLRLHKKSAHEQKVRAFQCDCGSKFKNKIGLSTHKKAVHDQKEFRCKYCDSEYKYNSSLRTHVRSVHDARKYVCNKSG